MAAAQNEAGHNLDEFLEAFASLSVKTKAEAHRLDQAYLRRLHFTGSSLAELEDWEPYQDPNAVKQSCGHSEAVVMVKGESVDQLKPVSEERLKRIEDEYKKKNIWNPSKEDLEKFLMELANKHDYITGKWMWFIHQSEVTRIWRALCRDAVEGKLPKDVLAVMLGPVLVPGHANAKEKEVRKINLKVRNVFARGMNHRIKRYLKHFNLKILAKLKSDIATHVQIFEDTPGLHLPVSLDGIYITQADLQ